MTSRQSPGFPRNQRPCVQNKRYTSASVLALEKEKHFGYMLLFHLITQN